MPLTLQAKLLRVLESRTFRPLGGKQELSSDFRLVSATRQSAGSSTQKEFRQDLYYRLFQYPITLPRLAARLKILSCSVSTLCACSTCNITRAFVV